MSKKGHTCQTYTHTEHDLCVDLEITYGMHMASATRTVTIGPLGGGSTIFAAGSRAIRQRVCHLFMRAVNDVLDMSEGQPC